MTSDSATYSICFFSSCSRVSASIGLMRFRSVSLMRSTIFCDSGVKMVSCIGAGVARLVMRQMADRAALGILVFGQDFARAMHHVGGQSSQLRDFDAIALVGRTFFHLAQKNNSAAALFHANMKVLYAAEAVGQLGQLVIVGGEQGLGASVGVNVFDSRPGDGQAIIGRRCRGPLRPAG